MILKNKHPALFASVAAAAFVAYGLVVGVASAAVVIPIGVAFGIFMGIGRYREQRGRAAYPVPALIALAVGAIALYAWLFLIKSHPAGVDWLPVVVIVAIPLLLLWRVWKTRRK